MDKIGMILTNVGFCLLLIGGAGMDSESILVPMVMALAGIVVMRIGVKLDADIYRY